VLATLRPLEAEPAPSDLSSPIATSSADSSDLQKSLAQSGDRRAPLSLVVDGVQKADNVVVILRANDVLVKETDLLAAAVPLPEAALVDVKGTRYVSLASLAPHVTYRIDFAAIALDLQVEPSLLGHSAVAVGEPRPSGHFAKADPSGFLTYSVSSSTANLGERASGFLQAGAGSAAAGLFTASASYADGTGHRGLFAYQKESEQHLSRFTLGDEYASTGNLGANVIVGGFGTTRHFEFQSDYAYFPTPGLRGTVLSPTTADLYVNGAFLRSVQLAPGAFDLTGIPVPPGAGVTQVVLRDAYGNTQTLSGVYYQTRQLLRKGLTDYDYHVGFLRPNPLGNNDVYGPFAALGDYRVGLSDAVTIGARIERTAGTLSGGPQFDVALPIGHVSLEAAASSAFGARGHALGAAYDYSSSRFGISLSAQTESASYSTASLQPNAPRQRSSVRESFGLPISRAATLNVSSTTTTYTGQPAAGQLLANLTWRPPRRGLFINLSAERDTGGSIFGLGGSTSAAHWTFGAQATFLTSRNSDLTIGTSDVAGTSSTTFTLSKSAPTGPGFGYQVQGTTGADRSAAAQVSYQTQYGDIQTLSNSGVGPSSTSLTLTGGLVGFRQGVFFTRPVSGAYSLVDVPGFAHLPVFFNNQYAGRTDRRGEMVVPNLSPYYDNQVGIDELRDRLDLTEDKSVEQVRPKDLSGVVTEFIIRHFHAYTGYIIVHRGGHSIVPVLGRLVFSHAGNDYPSDLGREGQFYVENLEAGNYAATVTTTDGLTCAFQIDLPNSPDQAIPVTSVGTLTCEATA
jgi:outer membrane usher protein